MGIFLVAHMCFVIWVASAVYVLTGANGDEQTEEHRTEKREETRKEKEERSENKGESSKASLRFREGLV